jgi:hypothetical protein
MKIDGGKNLTSSGYIPWYGQNHMNRRFEPDFFSRVNYFLSRDKNKGKTSKYEKGSDEWIAEVQCSNWATHNEDAHFKVMQEYKNE